MVTAYSYIRFSTKHQEWGDSLDRQLASARRWCRMNEVTLSDTTYEDLGRSAYSGKRRPALEEMIECVRSGSIKPGSFVLFEDADRVSRQGWQHAIELLQTLVNLGVKFVTLNNGQIYDQSNIQNLSIALPFLFESERAWLESCRKSTLVKSAKRAIRERHEISGHLPFWLSHDDGQVVLNDKATIARTMVDLKLEGWSNIRIARHINTELKVPSPYGKTWSNSTIKVAITNPVMYGAKQYYETSEDGSLIPVELVPGMFPPICSFDEYSAIQPGKRNGVGSLEKKGIFVGLLRCGFCGAALVRRRSRNKVSYRCSGRMVDPDSCKTPASYRLTEETLEYALRHLAYVKLSEKSIDVKPIAVLEEKLRSLESAKAYITNGSALGRLYDDIANTEEELATRRAEYEAHQSQQKAVDYQLIFSLKTAKEKNTELRKVINSISLERINASQIKFNVRYKTGDANLFVAEYPYRGDTFTIKFNSDTKRLREAYAAMLEEE